MTARKPVVIVGSSMQVLQSGDTIDPSVLSASFAYSNPPPKLVRSCLPAVGTIAPVSGRACVLYMGQATADLSTLSVAFSVTTAGAGTQVAEVGIFSSPSAPNFSPQTLTKIAAVSCTATLTSVGHKQQSISCVIPVDTHWWVAFRQAMSTTQATYAAVGHDLATNTAGILSGASALTGISTIAFSGVGSSTSGQVPNFVVQLA